MSTRNATVRRAVPATPVRPMTWHNQSTTLSLTPAAGQKLVDLSHPRIQSGAEGTGTCIRMLLTVGIHNAAATTTPDITSIGIGVGVLTADALAALVSPDPLSDTDQDWYYWWGGSRQVSSLGLEWSADIRSARKLRGGYRLVLVAENETNELTTVVDVTARTLWKMP